MTSSQQSVLQGDISQQDVLQKDEFDRMVSLLIECGAMKDKNWPTGEVRHRTRQYLKLWRKMQKDMVYTKSTITYVELKGDRKGDQKDVLEAAKQGDINTFTVIKSYENHHAIIDERGEILGYRYRIKPDLLEKLAETTGDLPHKGVNAGIRGNYPTRHYAVWRDYAKVPYVTSEYRKELPASKEWCEKNGKLFDYLSEGLRMISPMTYVRYGGARPYLEARHNLEPLCGIWFGVAINEGITGSTGTHLDFGDAGYNCVVPWGEYNGGGLVLWPLKIVMELEPGDAFFFMGSLIAHNVAEVEGVRNSIDLFCHLNVLSWKDKCDEERWGKKLN
jgi:hypothetical protein